MLRLEAKIVIVSADGASRFEYSYANEIEINTGFEGLTDTARVVFPRRNGIEEKQIISGVTPLFKRGDSIEIWLGYFPRMKKAFRGFITSINPKFPLEITCEDEMWTLKRTQARKFTGSNVTLKQLLTAILPEGYEFTALDVNIGDWRVSGNSNVTNVLKELRTQGLYARIVNGKLYVGLAFDPATQKTEAFYFEQNVIEDGGLKYQLVEDVRVKIKVNVFYPDNRKVAPYEFGDQDGDLRTINLYNVPEADIRQAAQRELDRLKYTGYRGSFTTFGEPYVNTGDAAAMISTQIPERNGNYLIKSVRRNWGVNGYRQEIELETKI